MRNTRDARIWPLTLSFCVDVIDVVKDTLHGSDYALDEDPRIYVSQKTGRGPISENWIAEYGKECKVRIL